MKALPKLLAKVGVYVLQVVSVLALVAHFSGLLFQMTFALARFFLDGKLFNFKSALHIFFYLFVLLYDVDIISKLQCNGNVFL